MAECILMKSGGGAGSDECTAAKADVLAGKTAVTKDSNDEAAVGTMPNRSAWASRIGVNGKAVIPAGYHNGSGYVDQAINNRGAVSATLAINGTYTIPEGYHNGSGKVAQSIPTMGAQTITPSSAAQTVSCAGRYMTGNITVNGANLLKQVTGTTKTVSGSPWQSGQLAIVTAVDVTTQIAHPVLAVFWIALSNDLVVAIVKSGGAHTSWGAYETGNLVFNNRIYAPFARSRTAGETVNYMVVGY